MSGLITTPTNADSGEGNATPSPKRSVGRPKTALGETEKARTSFILEKSQVNKLRYAALVDDKTVTQVLSEIIGDYLSKWEDEHGSFPDVIG